MFFLHNRDCKTLPIWKPRGCSWVSAIHSGCYAKVLFTWNKVSFIYFQISWGSTFCVCYCWHWEHCSIHCMIEYSAKTLWKIHVPVVSMLYFFTLLFIMLYFHHKVWGNFVLVLRVFFILCLFFYFYFFFNVLNDCDRLDRQTQATTFIHQVFGGYLRSRGTFLTIWLISPYSLFTVW